MRTPRTPQEAARHVAEVLLARPRTLPDLLAEFTPGPAQADASIALAVLVELGAAARNPDGIWGLLHPDGPMRICPLPR